MQAAFQDSVHDSQQCFRLILQAMSEPGTKVTLPRADADMSIAAASLSSLLTLTDQSTKVWLDDTAKQPALLDYLYFHSSPEIVAQPQDADFAVITNPLKIAALTSFSLGTEEQPHESCTLIIETKFEGASSVLMGPGIEHDREVMLGLPDSILAERQLLGAMMPCGLDLILVDGQDVIALPRTTLIKDY